jgi:hypothetical protein
MSERLFKFLLSELHTVRVLCKNPKCGMTSELPIALLRNYGNTCHHCQALLCDPSRNDLKSFAEVAELLAGSGLVGLEFVLPDEGSEGGQ